MKRFVLIAGAAWVTFIGVTSAVAQSTPPTPTPSEVTPHELQYLWQRNWRLYANYFVPFEEDYVAAPKYDRRYASSAHMTIQAVMQDRARRVQETVIEGLVRQRTVNIPRAEAQAAAEALPAMEVFEYGYIHSAEVEEILGEDDMVVKEVWLIDAEAVQRQKDADDARVRASGQSRRDARIDDQYTERLELARRQNDRTFRGSIRIKGWSTRGLDVGDRWRGDRTDQGMQIAVVREEEVARATGPRSRLSASRRGRTRLVAIPASWFERQQMSEEQFKDLLTRRGYDETSFINLIRDVKARHPEGSDPRIVSLLQRGREETAPTE